MTKLKKFACLILALIIILPIFSGCAGRGAITLRILHWADYMDETLFEDFEKYYEETYGQKVNILFEAVEKPEVMAVKIEKGKEPWDILCPSESVLERLLKQNLLKPIDTSLENMPNYNNYVSPAMKERSKDVEDSAKTAIQKMVNSGEEKYQELFDGFDFEKVYSVGYMWGNFGILYNTEKMAGYEGLLESWAALWNTDEFKGQMMMKNGPRESFAIGIIYVYREPLKAFYEKYEETGNSEDLEAYKDFLADIFQISGNSGKTYNISGKSYEVYRGNDLVAKVEEALATQKKTAGTVYEMDDGKDAMVNKEYAMDMAWNGDAVWAMSETEDPDLLDFAIPKEGSNFWIDSWVIPKYSKNSEIAEKFIDFLCSPDSSVRNMEYVGYTSVNSSEEILKWAILNGGNFDEPIDASYFFCKNQKGADGKYVPMDKFLLTDEEDRQVWYDYNAITKSFTVFAYESGGKLYDRETGELIDNPSDFIEFEVDVTSAFVNDIQYPSLAEYDRCGVMLGYSDYNDEILEMWTRVKGARLPVYVIIGLSLLLTAAVALGVYFLVKKNINNKVKTKVKSQVKPKKV